MKKLNRNENGFTLIEILVSLVITSILLLGVVSLFTNSSSLNRAQAGLSILQENGRYAITRIKSDVENAGRQHCASIALPRESTNDWKQGADMTEWQVSTNTVFANGLPNVGDVKMDSNTDADQLEDPFSFATEWFYPLDPSYFIRGHECTGSNCLPSFLDVGSDASGNVPNPGTGNGQRALNSDVLTVRYLEGGKEVIGSNGLVLTLDETVTTSTANTLVADCDVSYVAPAIWSGNTVTLQPTAGAPSPSLKGKADTKAYRVDEEVKTVSYFVQIDNDPNNATRKISSLYRSENGNAQQLVEGVERLDFFYLVQLQTGHVVRMTADQVNQVTGGGDLDNDGALDSIEGCVVPPKIDQYLIDTTSGLANDRGCLWRSVYAVELHLLMNTVNDSAPTETEAFIYSPDGITAQTPGTVLPSGLDRGKMYRREFTAVIPIRSYTL